MTSLYDLCIELNNIDRAIIEKENLLKEFSNAIDNLNNKMDALYEIQINGHSTLEIEKEISNKERSLIYYTGMANDLKNSIYRLEDLRSELAGTY